MNWPLFDIGVRKDFVEATDFGGEFRIPWRGIGHYHKAAPHCVEPACHWKGLLEDCPRTRWAEEDQ